MSMLSKIFSGRPPKPVGDDLTGSFRMIAFVTPTTFLKPIQVISTIWSYEQNGGETIFGHVDALNHNSINFQDIEWSDKPIYHKSAEEALRFHIQNTQNTIHD